MLRTFTILFSLFLAITHASAQHNIKEIIGPIQTCPDVPVRYRVVFNTTCSTPSITDIRKYNQNEGGGRLASAQFVSSGYLPTGEFYEDFDLIFSIYFGQFPNGDAIGIVFESLCSGTNQQVKGLTIGILPPPTVSIVSEDGNSTILTRHLRFGWIGLKDFIASVSTLGQTYKWTVSGDSFGISGADDQSTVTVSSTADGYRSGTLSLRVGTSTCDPVYATYTVLARPDIGVRISKSTSGTTLTLADNNGESWQKKRLTDSIELKIYGNPVANKLVAKIVNHSTSNLDKKNVLVYDASMRLLKTYWDYENNSSTITLDVSSLSSGIYFLRIVSDKNIALTEKFVVQR